MTRINTNVSSLTAQKSLARANNSLQEVADPSEHRSADQHRQGRSGRFDRQRGSSYRHHQRGAGDQQQRAGQPDDRHGRQCPGPGQLAVERHPRSGDRGGQHGRHERPIRSRPTSCRSTRRWRPSTASPRRRRSRAGSCSTAASTSSPTATHEFDDISDLQIDQANLGATDQIDVEIEIAQAAAKAQVTNATNVDTKATTTLSFGTGFQLDNAAENAEVSIALTGTKTAPQSWSAHADLRGRAERRRRVGPRTS